MTRSMLSSGRTSVSTVAAAVALIVVAAIVGASLWYSWGSTADMGGSAPPSRSTGTSPPSTSATTSPTNSVSTSNAGVVSFYFIGGSAVLLNASTQEANVTVRLVNNGSDYLPPSVMKNKVPEGTTLVPGTWAASYFDPNGTYICTAPQGMGSVGCEGSLLPRVADGGRIVVSFLSTGARVGDTLSLAYSYNGDTQTIEFAVIS